jgi:hypothetical protein
MRNQDYHLAYLITTLEERIAMEELLQKEIPFLLNRLIPQLLTATLCGFIVGYGREIRHRPAGIRTNILIAMQAWVSTLLKKIRILILPASLDKSLPV